MVPGLAGRFFSACSTRLGAKAAAALPRWSFILTPACADDFSAGVRKVVYVRFSDLLRRRRWPSWEGAAAAAAAASVRRKASQAPPSAYLGITPRSGRTRSRIESAWRRGTGFRWRATGPRGEHIHLGRTFSISSMRKILLPASLQGPHIGCEPPGAGGGHLLFRNPGRIRFAQSSMDRPGVSGVRRGDVLFHRDAARPKHPTRRSG